MPKFKANEFTEYEFTEVELYEATRFTTSQKMLFQSLISQEASKKIALQVDLGKYPSKEDAIAAFLQAEAECQGGIRTLMWLLWLEENTAPPTPEVGQQKAEIVKPAGQT